MLRRQNCCRVLLLRWNIRSWQNCCRVTAIKAELTIIAKLRSCLNIVIYEDHMVINNSDAMEWTILIKRELLKPFRYYVAKLGLSETLVKKPALNYVIR